MLLGIKWLDPEWLLSEFGGAFIWVSLVIVFVECGLFFPFLPGDTLLFALGLFIAGGDYQVLGIDNKAAQLTVAISMLATAAFLGNVVGYEIGRRIGPPLYERDGRLLKRKHLDKTSEFFEKHGNKALVIGRLRALRAHLHHRHRRRDDDAAPPLLRLERDRRRALGGQHRAARLLPRRDVPGPRREHRLRGARDPGLLGDPGRLRVVEAPPPQPPARSRCCCASKDASPADQSDPPPPTPDPTAS